MSAFSRRKKASFEPPVTPAGVWAGRDGEGRNGTVKTTLSNSGGVNELFRRNVSNTSFRAHRGLAHAHR